MRATLRHGLLVLGMLAMLSGLTACAPGLKEPEMTLEQSREQIAAFIQATFAAAAPGRTPAPSDADGARSPCQDSLGRYDDWSAYNVERRIGQVDDTIAKQLEQRVTEFWRGRGLPVDRNANDPGIVDLRTAVGGINYNLMINRNAGFALMNGITPCYPPS